MTTGQRLAHYRKRSGMTQQQVGEQINMSAQAVSKWENDQAEPDIPTICKLADLYQVSVDALLTGKEPEQTAAESALPTAPRKPGFFKKHWKLVLILAIVLVVAITATVIIVWQVSKKNAEEAAAQAALEQQRAEEERYRQEHRFELELAPKFLEITVGMSKDEVKAVLGEPEATGSSAVDRTGSSFSQTLDEAMKISQYGYADCEFWYYRDHIYAENQRIVNAGDMNAELKPYAQIRIAFDGEGRVIESYYNPACRPVSVMDDYGGGEKTVSSCEYTDKIRLSRPGWDLLTERAQMTVYYEDGAKVRGTFAVAKVEGEKLTKEGCLCSIDLPWGEYRARFLQESP
ncbi:MAG: helix-turn-helix domain-containing protein [Clostridia bacterium]|nr:helix-turn-helix domain-containing protein [Clostridia bacterium]